MIVVNIESNLLFRGFYLHLYNFISSEDSMQPHPDNKNKWSELNNIKHDDGNFRNYYPEPSCVANYNNFTSIVAFIAKTEQTVFSGAANSASETSA